MPFAGMAYIGLAGTLYERNDLDGTMHCVTKGLELSKQARNVDTIKDGYLGLALLRQALGDPDAALEAVRELQDLAQSSGDRYWLARAFAFRSQWWLNCGNIAAAADCAQDGALHARDVTGLVREFAGITTARVLVAQASSPGADQPGATGQALSALAELLQAAEAARRQGSTIKILALQALAFQAQGDVERALSALGRALSLAEPEGYLRTFVDEGPPMARLLYEAATHGIAPDYARRLLAAFPLVQAERDDTPGAPAPSSDLIEPLSEREIEVLALLAEGLTNREIAARLYLSLNTVKVHARNIYGKIGVHNRTQAVARARVLGLLPST
jgi:LuxR family maltose regulon positive regulatory protein